MVIADIMCIILVVGFIICGLYLIVAYIHEIIKTRHLPKTPCNCGDTLFVVRESDLGEFTIDQVMVTHFTICENGNYIVTVTKDGYFERYDFEWFEQEIFSNELGAKHEIEMMKG